MRTYVLAILHGVGLLLSACDTADPSPGDERRRFGFIDITHEETFVAATSEPEVIEEVEAQRRAEERGGIGSR